MSIYIYFQADLHPDHWRIFELKRHRGELYWLFKDFQYSEEKVIQYYPSAIRFPHLGRSQVHPFNQAQFEEILASQ